MVLIIRESIITIITVKDTIDSVKANFIVRAIYFLLKKSLKEIMNDVITKETAMNDDVNDCAFVVVAVKVINGEFL